MSASYTETTLSKDETVIAQIEIQSALFAKNQFELTNKRVIARGKKTLLGVLLVGEFESTYPLKNIAGVSFTSQLKVGRLLIEIFIVLWGLGTLSHFIEGLIILAVGVLVVVSSFPGAFVVANTAGQKLSHDVWFTGRQAAQDFVAKVNSTIAEL